MTRALPFSFDAAERGDFLVPAVELQWSDRYLGRAVFRASGSADDGLAADRVGLVYRSQSSELLQIKSNGTAVEVQRRNGATLVVTSAWTTLATAGLSGTDVALTRAEASLVDDGPGQDAWSRAWKYRLPTIQMLKVRTTWASQRARARRSFQPLSAVSGAPPRALSVLMCS